MTIDQVLLVAGTHGNEINAPLVFDQWLRKPDLINKHQLKVLPIIGNPMALGMGKRYIDRDLNRSFSNNLISSLDVDDFEVKRARELIKKYGPKGVSPSQIVIDFHSTTAAMGTSLVVYGRRPVDLAIVSLLQSRLGLPIYLHEGDEYQTGFLVESWPCGFVVEIGPVSQGLIHHKIIDQILLTLDVCLLEISNVIKSINKCNFPDQLVVHRHIKNIDFPRDTNGKLTAFVHPDVQGKDWYPIKNSRSLFMTFGGNTINASDYFDEEEMVPVFINEAAYAEKNIAMALTKREIWDFNPTWRDNLCQLVSC